MGWQDDMIATPAAPQGGGWQNDAVVQEATAGGTQDWEPRQFTSGEKVKRKIGLAAQGLNDSLYGLALAPADVSGWIARKVGLVSPDAAPPSRTVTNALASVPSAIGLASPGADTRIEPAGAGERAAQGVGEGVGNAIGAVTGAGLVANTARGVTQGVANVLRSQPVLQTTAAGAGGAVGGATENPWLGLGTALAVPVGASVVRRTVTPVTNALTPQEGRLVAAADAEGIPLTPAQRTGSPSLEFIESTLAKTPGAAGPQQRAFQNQHQQFNARVLDRAGVTATDASPDTLNRAFITAGQTFDDLAARTVVRPDGQFVNDVTQVTQNYGRRLPTDVAPVFQSYVDDLAPLLQAARTPGANPQIAGDVYQTIRSDIAKRARESQNNLPLQRALDGLVDALDDVMERSTSGALRREWQTARREYQALITVDKAMQGGTQEVRSVGNIPFGSFTNAVKGGDRAGYARGRGQLNEMSRIGDYIADKVPNSGTPTRNFAQNPLNWLYMGPLNVLSRAYNSAPAQAYLTNTLMGRTNYGAQYGGTAVREALEGSQPDRNALRRGGERR